MSNKETLSIVKYLLELNVLKRLKRSGSWLVGIKDPDTIAEHQWRTTIIAYILGKQLGADIEKILLMGVIHDNAESRIGDLNKMMKLYFKKGDAEINAFKDQVSGLPEEISKELNSIFLEYENRESIEAKIVKDADTLELAFQSLEYLQIGYSAHLNWLEDLENRLIFEESKIIFRELIKADINDWWKGII